MKILLVDSGGPGFHNRYSYDIFTTLTKSFQIFTRQVSPQHLTPGLIAGMHPDIMLVMHGSQTPVSMVHHAKAMGVTTVLWLVEDPYEIDMHRGDMVNSYHYVFTNEKVAVGQYGRPNVYYLPWCCNPQVNRKMGVPEKYQSDLCFIGMGFRNRVRTMNYLVPWIQHLNVKLIGDWENWGEGLHPSLKRFVTPTVNDFWEVQKYYNGAKINLNIHRDPVDPPFGNSLGVGAVSPNDRVFALAGCGAFQIVDRTRPALWECFIDGTEIIGYSAPDELGQKIHYYLGNPQIRSAIGNAAQKKAYTQHTFKHRLAEMFRIIGKKINRRPNESVYTGGGQNKQVFRNVRYY